MSELERIIREVVRDVVREEIASLPSSKPRLLTPDEAADRLDVNRQTLYRLVRENQISATRTSPSRFKVAEGEIERFIRDGGFKTCLREVPAPKVSRGGSR